MELFGWIRISLYNPINSSLTEETFKIALHVITGAGFGVPFTWNKSSDEVWPKHTLSFRDAVSNLVNNLLPLVVLPKVVRQLPVQSLRTVEEAYGEFGTYLREILAREKALSKEGKDQDAHPNLLSALVKHAAMVEEGGVSAALTDQEIIGNTFIFLIAGHETTYLLIRCH
jgi:cytochrome P450